MGWSRAIRKVEFRVTYHRKKGMQCKRINQIKKKGMQCKRIKEQAKVSCKPNRCCSSVVY